MRACLRKRSSGLLASALMWAATTPVLAQNGTISGKVTDQATGQALEAARVILTGTSLIETSNREGEYTFRT